MKQDFLVRIVSTVVIHRPLEEVFRMGATPRNWPIWHPNATSVTGAIDHPVIAGAEILERDRFAFLVGCIRFRVRHAVAPRTWTVDGVLDEIPFFSGTETSIRYTLTPVTGGTRLERDMTYRVPNAVGRLLDRLYFRAHNRRQSQRAIERMKVILEQGAAAAAAQPSAGQVSKA